MLLAGHDSTLLLLRVWRICNSHVRKPTSWEPCFKVLSLGWLVRWRFSGTTGGLWQFGPTLPSSSPGVSVYAHTSPASVYVAFAVTSVILILHYLFGRPALVFHKLPASTASTRTRTDGTPTILANTREGRDVRTR